MTSKPKSTRSTRSTKTPADPTLTDLRRELAAYKGLVAAACAAFGINPVDPTDQNRMDALRNHIQSIRASNRNQNPAAEPLQ